MVTRKCGECTLCCKLLPVKELGKPASCRCQYQRFTGCSIYSSRPPSCRLWSCSWLTDPATSELRRPDRSHYVIDPSPDCILVTDNITGTSEEIDILQIWCDPKYPKAHEDPHLRKMLDENKIIALVRYHSYNAFVLFPPSRSSNGKWNYRKSDVTLSERPKRASA